jgi:hypothetical protein
VTTKNLARTVIEGGRTDDYKADVFDAIRAERCATRTFLREARLDAEAVEDVAAPKRRPLRPSFADKLGPVRAFLDSRLGRSWDETRSLLTERFDPRTTPGRHVIHDHVLGDVAQHGEHVLQAAAGWIRFRYFVDERGLLRRVPKDMYARGPTLAPSPNPPRRMSTPEALGFLKDRMVGRLGTRYVWFDPVRSLGDVRLVIDDFNAPVWAAVGPDGRPARDPSPPPPRHAWERTSGPVHAGAPLLRSRVPFRASGLLTRDEEERFLSINEVVRQRILDAARDQR